MPIQPKITNEQFQAALDMEYSAGAGELGRYDSESVSEATARVYGPTWDKTNYLHVTDHEYALDCLYGHGKYTLRQVYDSWIVTKDLLITEANRKCGAPATGLYSCLTLALGTGNGSRIYDRIYAGEVGLIKGKYAGIDYDCSMWPLPNGGGTNPPPPDPPPGPPPPTPPSPIVPLVTDMAHWADVMADGEHWTAEQIGDVRHARLLKQRERIQTLKKILLG